MIVDIDAPSQITYYNHRTIVKEKILICKHDRSTDTFESIYLTDTNVIPQIGLSFYFRFLCTVHTCMYFASTILFHGEILPQVTCILPKLTCRVHVMFFNLRMCKETRLWAPGKGLLLKMCARIKKKYGNMFHIERNRTYDWS